MDKKQTQREIFLARMKTPEAIQRKKQMHSERSAFLTKYELATAAQDHEARMAGRLPEEFKYDAEKVPYRNAPAIRRARSLYLMDYPFERIFLETDLPYSVFIRLRKRWTVLKERIDSQVLEKIRTEAIGDRAEEFVKKGLALGLRFLDRQIEKGTDFSPKDFKLVMDSVLGIHRVKQLETGGATDISVYEKMSPEELREYLDRNRQELIAENPDLLEFLPASADKSKAH